MKVYERLCRYVRGCVGIGEVVQVYERLCRFMRGCVGI